ncbi:MAG: FtsL-like putative cell division protein [Bacteroidales bacterium]|jgi:hypothetical protein|nr:FtsL-like putative cell division protein [Bacteroidales bacterium]MDD4214745.1 FtsL-like putative cell division protein [Bacteroidales bacterium]
MTQNEFKTETNETVKEKKKIKKTHELRLWSIFRSILNGEVLTTQAVLKLLPFVFYLCFLVALYIGNSYNYERGIKKASILSDQLIELENEYIKTQSELMLIKLQSEVAKRLDSLKTGIKEPETPPKSKINAEEKHKATQNP